MDSRRVRFNIFFEHNPSSDEKMIYECENISTPEEFNASYWELCAHKSEFIDKKRTLFPLPYVIKIIGTMNDKPYEKNFTNINAYHDFLIAGKYMPLRVDNRLRKI